MVICRWAPFTINFFQQIRRSRVSYQHYHRALSCSATQSQVQSAPAFRLPLKHCCGCGAQFHTSDNSKPGYLPEHIVEEKRRHAESLIEDGIDVNTAISEASHSLICMRCHQLTYNGVPQGNMQDIVADDFRTLLKDRLLGQTLKSSVIIKLADITNFQASIFPDLTEIIGGSSPVILVANKFDLLPKGAPVLRIKQWVKSQAQNMHIPVRTVHVISSKTGLGMSSVINDAQELAERTNRDIYVLGSCNVGKSTFINNLLRNGLIKGVNRGVRMNRIRMRDGMKQVSKQIPVTTSNIAGTTLGVIPFTIRGPASKSAVKLFDTPGVYADLPLLRQLTGEERDLLAIKRSIAPVSYSIKQGQSLLLAGLARIDHVDGPPFLFTAYTSPNVKLHVTQTAKAADLIKNRPDILGIPSDPSRALSSLSYEEFRIMGEGWVRSSNDIFFDGLGWVSFTGCSSISVRVFSLGGVGIRPPLMPFDARSTARRFTG